jgi:hypothetical protein
VREVAEGGGLTRDVAGPMTPSIRSLWLAKRAFGGYNPDVLFPRHDPSASNRKEDDREAGHPLQHDPSAIPLEGIPNVPTVGCKSDTVSYFTPGASHHAAGSLLPRLASIRSGRWSMMRGCPTPSGKDKPLDRRPSLGAAQGIRDRFDEASSCLQRQTRCSLAAP